MLKGNSEDKVAFATVPHPGLPLWLFFQLINKLWGFYNLRRASACCLGLNSFTSAHGQYSGHMDFMQTTGEDILGDMDIPGRAGQPEGHPLESLPTSCCQGEPVQTLASLEQVPLNASVATNSFPKPQTLPRVIGYCSKQEIADRTQGATWDGSGVWK